MKYTFKIVFFILLFGIYLPSETVRAQLKSYSFEQLDSLQSQQKRTVVVFIHTDWCKFCQAMKNTTLKNREIINKLNEYFYFIEFNAESKKTIQIKNRRFDYKPTGNNTGIHELAEELALIDGKIAYPTISLLNSNFEILYQINSFINSKQLLKILQKLK